MTDTPETCWLNEDCIAGYHHDGVCRFPSWMDAKCRFFYATERPHDPWGDFSISYRNPMEKGRDIASMEEARELAETCASGTPGKKDWVKTSYGIIYEVETEEKR